MATLTPQDLLEMRRFLETTWVTVIDFTKPTINAGFQALEDEFERTVPASRPGFEEAAAADVQIAVAPKVFTNPELKLIGQAFLKIKVKL